MFFLFRSLFHHDSHTTPPSSFSYDSLNLDKNACVAQLHAALLPDTHLFQV